MTIHVKSVRIELSKKGMRKRKMRELRRQVLKYGAILGVCGIGYSVYCGGFPNQVEAVKRMTSDAVALVISPVTDGKKNVSTYVNKVENNKAAYEDGANR